MPGRLARALRDCGVDLSSQELLDVLWLAARLPRDASAPLARAAGAAAREGAREPGRAGDGAGAGARPADGAGPAPEAGCPPGEPEDGAGAALHAAAGPAAAGPAPAARRALAPRVPEDKALAAELPLGRALRPLKRQRPGGRGFEEIDEEATVRVVAETGLPDVVPRPGRERWLDLALLVDDGVSMLLWRRLCAELRALLERIGAFRTVRVYGLRSRGPGAPRLSGRPWSGEATLDAGAACDPSGRTLVLVVSDGVGAMWRDGRMRAALERWARRGPTAVVHTLPPRMWPGSGIRAEPWQVTVRQAGAANDTWRVADPVLPPELAAFDGVPVPVLEPEPSAVGAWARLVSSEGGCAVLPLLAPHEPAAAPGPAPEPDDALLRFRDAASPEAYRLAAHLAAVAPVSVPVMRLVQAAVPWRAETAHLAEVFLGGLMRRGSDEGLPPRFQRFDFDERARTALLDAVPAAELLATARAVTGRLAALAGRSPDFPAWLAHPDGEDALPGGARPFAWVGRGLLTHFGVEGPAAGEEPAAGEGDGPAGEGPRAALVATRHLAAAPSPWRRAREGSRVGPYLPVLRNAAGRTENYLAEDAAGRRVLVQVPLLSGADPESGREEVRTIRAALERMAGRHAPALVAADPEGGPPWVAMEPELTRSGRPAPTLRELMAVRGWRLSPESFALLGVQLAEALAVCHAEGMAHGSLSPDTVLVSEDRIRVVGWARTRFGGGRLITEDLRALGRTLLAPARTHLAAPLPDPAHDVLRHCLMPDPTDVPAAARVARALASLLPPPRELPRRSEPPREGPVPEPPPPPPAARLAAVLDLSRPQERGTTTAVLGMLLAQVPGRRVLAVNAAPAVSALDNRIRCPEPVRAQRLDVAGARAFVARHRSGLHVLTYTPRGAAGAIVRDERFTAAAGAAYTAVLLEPGDAGLDAARVADRLLLVVPYTADGFDRAERTLNRLAATGHAHLAANAVVAVQQGDGAGGPQPALWAAEARIRDRCRALVFLPADRELGRGVLDTTRLPAGVLNAHRVVLTALGL
ncbi:hypothetical protein GCM10027168_39010 [Streptomyces capparidis]